MNSIVKPTFRAWHGIALAVVATPLAIWGLEASLNAKGQAKAQVEQPSIEQPGQCTQANAGTESMQMRRMTIPQPQQLTERPAVQPAAINCQPGPASAM